MGCFWIGINHTSHGCVKVSPARRLLLELISGVLLAISWCIILAGLIHVGALFVNSIEIMANQNQTERRTEETFEQRTDRIENIMMDIYAVVPFMLGNTLYLIATIIYSILNLIYRKDILIKKTVIGRPEWKEREKKEFCFDICNPLNGLRIFHHLEHRGALLINLLALGFTITGLSVGHGRGSLTPEDMKLLSTALGYSIIICLITLAQTFLSYFYAEDVALCGMSCCCIHFWFIRRYPQEQTDVALTVANEENPARLGKYNQFQNEDDSDPPAYSEGVQQV